ncbi:MAG: beta-ketoacyl-[acyl-carrier-protein] synthase II [Verrucomicrobia bacterium]|nr:MAG: beta-ketoacyl-[acyl-carrier-protein] synthase II [Verrucomicrobiota bacterium]
MTNAEQPRKRIVVTGLGVITSIGTGIEQYWENLLKGTSGITNVTRFDASEYSCQVASEVTDFDPAQYMDGKEVKRTDRYTHFAVAASKLAAADAKLDVTKLDPTRFGVIIGSGIGGMETIEQQSRRLFEQGPRKVSPFMIPSLIANIASGIVAIEFNAKGPNFSVVSACATGSHALGEALDFLRKGDADIMLAGGSEAAITRLGFAGFCAMRAMSTQYNNDPKHSCRPFDLNRDGFVMGEGAGVLVLETLEHAQARGAKIYCEIAGYGATCDAYHITSPDPTGNGLANCIKAALDDANIKPEQVDYVNAHGTSTPYNDKFETMSLKTVFGPHANKLLISSTKSMTGHLLGAAGGIEAAAAIKVIQTGEIPPTINYETPDPECDLDYVPNKKRSAKVNVALSENLGFGGQNAAVVFKRF